MNFNQHSKFEGRHAFLGASQYSWLNYDTNHLKEVFYRNMAKARGTRLHAFAAEAISLGIKLQRSNKTLNRYINDAIGYRMKPEVVLYYSDNCFGTTDAISFEKNVLRIHDLKTGDTPAKMEQLEIYAALFCLEYDIQPENISTILRIYQFDDYTEELPTAEQIRLIMNKIVEFDDIINEMIQKEMDI